MADLTPTVIHNYPFISETEFAAAASHLVDIFNRTRQTDRQRQIAKDDPYNLQTTTQSWSRVQFEKDTQILSIIRYIPIHPDAKPNDSDDISIEDEIIEDGDDDGNRYFSEATLSALAPLAGITVVYSILRDQTYQVPVLYLTASWTGGNPISDVDVIYQHIVSPDLKSLLQDPAIGVLGGLTMRYNPVTKSPAFCLHPCNTATFLEELHTNNNYPSDLPPQANLPVPIYLYMVRWIGIIGRAVGLTIPLEMVGSKFSIK